MIDPEFFANLINLRIKALSDEREQFAHNATEVELDQTRVGRLSRMDAMQMQQMELELSRRQQRELAALQNALNRIDEGDYGLCFECGEEINPKRLEIDLVATLCISCAQRRENLGT